MVKPPPGGPARGPAAVPTEYYRKGLGLKKEVQPQLQVEYGNQLLTLMRAQGNQLTVGRIRFQIAASMGFCYGVDRAVEYAYQCRTKFPDRRIFLVGEIIHNPLVNQRLNSMGIEFILPSEGGHFDVSIIEPDDVAVIPAFGVSRPVFDQLRETGCAVVDTTCGSVLSVWKRVEAYARDGFTSVIHGKHYHEETRATVSQATKYDGAHYFLVRNMAEAKLLCDFIRISDPSEQDAREFMDNFRGRSSPGFDPLLHLGRIGVANQTTMLATESLAIAAKIGEAMADRYGAEQISDCFRSFDTICSATQDRQDAVREMLRDPPDLMFVVGGYNSSNTCNLALLCSTYAPTFHIDTPERIDLVDGTIRHQKIMGTELLTTADWLPDGPLTIGMTAGASTPDASVGQVATRIMLLAGLDPEQAAAA